MYAYGLGLYTPCFNCRTESDVIFGGEDRLFRAQNNSGIPRGGSFMA